MYIRLPPKKFVIPGHLCAYNTLAALFKTITISMIAFVKIYQIQKGSIVHLAFLAIHFPQLVYEPSSICKVAWWMAEQSQLTPGIEQKVT